MLVVCCWLFVVVVVIVIVVVVVPCTVGKVRPTTNTSDGAGSFEKAVVLASSDKGRH